MKVSIERALANQTLVGKPCKIKDRIVGKVISVKGNKIIAEIHDLKISKEILQGRVSGYSMGCQDIDFKA